MYDIDFDLCLNSRKLKFVSFQFFFFFWFLRTEMDEDAKGGS
jgi:hypothetical protein